MAASAALCKPYSTSKQKLSAPICSTLLDDSGLYLCRKKLSYAIIKITGLISLKRGGRKRWFWRLDFKNHISTFFGFCIERNGCAKIKPYVWEGCGWNIKRPKKLPIFFQWDPRLKKSSCSNALDVLSAMCILLCKYKSREFSDKSDDGTKRVEGVVRFDISKRFWQKFSWEQQR